MFSQGEYLLPYLSSSTSGDDASIVMNGMLLNVRRRLKAHWGKINEIIIQHNVNTNDNVPLIREDLNLYAYRHTFAMNYIMNGGNPLALATQLGHSNSMRNLSSYIALLRSDSDLVNNIIEI